MSLFVFPSEVKVGRQIFYSITGMVVASITIRKDGTYQFIGTEYEYTILVGAGEKVWMSPDETVATRFYYPATRELRGRTVAISNVSHPLKVETIELRGGWYEYTGTMNGGLIKGMVPETSLFWVYK